MDPSVLVAIEQQLTKPVRRWSGLGGGDISLAYRLETDNEAYFCKLNSGSDALSLFTSEKKGLEAIAATATIRVPRVYACGQVGQKAFLLMEFIDAKRPESKDFRMLGSKLAMLHQKQADSFGWKDDNFIGSLPQSNREHQNWPEFFALERLLPQILMAEENGMLLRSDIPSEKLMLSVLEELCPNVRPSLLHGDLWSGNYLIRKDGVPFLIDPAVYFGHGEVDIAMSRLFGGFGDGFYAAYGDVFPGDGLSEDRIKIYQLYYLLVHLNLFGRSYYSGVKAILKSYFY